MTKGSNVYKAIGLAVFVVLAILLAGFVVFSRGGELIVDDSDVVDDGAVASELIGSNPTNSELAAFSTDMSELYQGCDSQKEFLQKVTLSADGYIDIVGSNATARQEVPVTVVDGELYVDGSAYIASLGCSAEGVSVVDGALAFLDGTTTSIRTCVTAGNLLYCAQDIVDILGCEVLEADTESISVTFPYQSARIVVRSSEDVVDDAAINRVHSIDGVYVFQYASAVDAVKACSRLQECSGVVSVSPDTVSFLTDADDDSAYGEDTCVLETMASDAVAKSVALSWGSGVIGSTTAKENLAIKYGNSTASEVVVAVVDTGVDMDHELFEGRLVDGRDYYADDADPDDENGHGTHCAGIIADNTPDSVKIMPLRTGGADGNLTETAVYSAIMYAVNKNVDVINMSFGGYFNSSKNWNSSSMEYVAVRAADSAGIVMVAAHGNDKKETTLIYPSSDAAVISVSAIDSNSDFATYSNYGQVVDFAAPGTSIYSSWIDGGYKNKKGTSMAAAFVSSCAALVLSDDNSLSSTDVRTALQNNAIDLGAEGWDEYFGYGCVYVGFIGEPAEAEAEVVARIGDAKFETLQAAIEAAQDGDVVTIVRDIVLDFSGESADAGTELPTAGIAIDKNITITSDGDYVISAVNKPVNGAFQICNGAAVSIEALSDKSLIFDGCDMDDAGPMFYVASGGSLNLGINVYVQHNVSTAKDSVGAAIVNEGNLLIDGAVVVQNTANVGAGVYNTGSMEVSAGQVCGNVNASGGIDGSDVYVASTAKSSKISGAALGYVSVASPSTLELLGSPVISGCIACSGEGSVVVVDEMSLNEGIALYIGDAADVHDGFKLVEYAEGLESNLDDFTILIDREAGVYGSARIDGQYLELAISSVGEASEVKSSGFELMRLGGSNRYATMAKIVDEGFSTTSAHAIVASGENFPDALAASALAGCYDCPVILTGSQALSADARAELVRLQVSSVDILGGVAAVSANVSDSIADMGIAVNRIAGATRQATSLELAKAVYQLNGAPDTVIVASGYGFADALSIGPWAYASKTPILLTTAEGNLTEDEVSFIKSAGISKVIIVGGENAVSKAVEDQVGDIDLERLGGATRYDTSKLIAQWSLNHGMSLSEVCVVSGLNFPDALAGAALAGGRCGIMVLVNGDGGVCLDWVLENSSDLSKVQVLGGESAVSQSVYDCLLPSLN